MATGIGLKEALGLGLALVAANQAKPSTSTPNANAPSAPVTGLGAQGGGFQSMTTYDHPSGSDYVAACFGGAAVGAGFGATLDLSTLGLTAGAGTAIGAGVGCGVGILGTYLASN
jgi:hypothetical protein